MPVWKVSSEILGFWSDVKELEKKKRSETTKTREEERSKQETEQRGLATAIDVILGTIVPLKDLCFVYQILKHSSLQNLFLCILFISIFT